MTSAIMAFLHHLAAFTLLEVSFTNTPPFARIYLLSRRAESNGWISSTGSPPGFVLIVGTPARFLLREGRSLLRPKLVLLDQDGWLCPGRFALHLPDNSVSFLDEISCQEPGS